MIDPYALPTTTAAPNVTVLFTPLLVDENTGQRYTGWRDFYLDTTDATGDQLGKLYRCVS